MKINTLVGGMLALAASTSAYRLLDAKSASLAVGLTISTICHSADALPFPLASISAIFTRANGTHAHNGTHHHNTTSSGVAQLNGTTTSTGGTTKNGTHHHQNGTTAAAGTATAAGTNGTHHHKNGTAATTTTGASQNGTNLDSDDLQQNGTSVAGTITNGTAVNGTSTNTTVSAASGTVTVQAGDTLLAISKAQGVSLAALEAANPGVNPATLQVGQVLNLPGGTASSNSTTISRRGMGTPYLDMREAIRVWAAKASRADVSM